MQALKKQLSNPILPLAALALGGLWLLPVIFPFLLALPAAWITKRLCLLIPKNAVRSDPQIAPRFGAMWASRPTDAHPAGATHESPSSPVISSAARNPSLIHAALNLTASATVLSLTFLLHLAFESGAATLAESYPTAQRDLTAAVTRLEAAFSVWGLPESALADGFSAVTSASDAVCRGLLTLLRQLGSWTALTPTTAAVTVAAAWLLAPRLPGLAEKAKHCLGNSSVRLSQTFSCAKARVLSGFPHFLLVFVLSATVLAPLREDGWLLAVLIAFLERLPLLGGGWLMLPLALGTALTNQTVLCCTLCSLYFLLLILRNKYKKPAIKHPLGLLLAGYVGYSFFSFPGLLLFPLAAALVFQLLFSARANS